MRQVRASVAEIDKVLASDDHELAEHEDAIHILRQASTAGHALIHYPEDEKELSDALTEICLADRDGQSSGMIDSTAPRGIQQRAIDLTNPIKSLENFLAATFPVTSLAAKLGLDSLSPVTTVVDGLLLALTGLGPTVGKLLLKLGLIGER